MDNSKISPRTGNRTADLSDNAKAPVSGFIFIKEKPKYLSKVVDVDNS